jgi:hypothetical protein
MRGPWRVDQQSHFTPDLPLVPDCTTRDTGQLSNLISVLLAISLVEHNPISLGLNMDAKLIAKRLNSDDSKPREQLRSSFIPHADFFFRFLDLRIADPTVSVVPRSSAIREFSNPTDFISKTRSV